MKIVFFLLSLIILGWSWYLFFLWWPTKTLPCPDDHMWCKIVTSARDQIWVVNHYDNEYYQWGYPPKDRGACTDVIIRALEANTIPFKKQVDDDIIENQKQYWIAKRDPNIDARRVKTLMKYFDRHREKIPIDTDSFDHWLPWDIVTYDQIPGRLRHIAIVSNKKTVSGRPYIIHNYGFGTIENDMLTKWPTKITGHWRTN